MADNVYVTEKITFQSNMELALQPRGGELLSTCKEGDLDGILAEIDDFFGAAETETVEGRHVPIVPTDGPQTRLWLGKPFPDYYDKLVNKQDQLMANIQLEGGYVMQGSAAIRRYHNRQWLNGFFNGRLTGQGGTAGTTLVPFPTAQVIPANYGFGASGSNHLNVAKIIQARTILALGDVDFDMAMAYMIVTPIQMADLLKEVQITSDEFKALGGRASADGKKIVQFLGFEFVELNLASPSYATRAPTTYTSPTTSQTVRKLPFWVKDGVYAGWWERMFTNITIREDLHYETQVYARSCMAVTRTQDGMSGFVECYES